ncbi:hypothetical protein [Thomasclavelia cocleata]|uniref:Uncharacterized protein n=1 Tax=Thomasclavelia cocleata TaxID=69824 RepID=A0A829Z9V7_9FIRM|nr:hypothetical protein [Thomasclavelia cocleata]GFI41133.1 hypothetical protein IMSAGC017_01173 [Thomasclavelia cocleata]
MMKTQSYEKVIDKDIVDVKRYLLDISESYWMQDIHDIVNKSMDIKIIKKKINKRKDLQLVIFSKIKKLIDKSVSLSEMENHLVFMNILLSSYYRPVLVYKYNLLNYIIDNGGFSIETYCLLRHLIKFNEKVIESFVDALANRLNLGMERYHYLTCYILLLEKNYKKAYLHLEYVIIDQEFERFLPALYNYSPRLYNKYLKKVDMPLNSILI